MENHSHTNTNTKLITHEFTYHGPASLEEALKLLREPNTAILAGGTDLINKLKLETAHPDHVVYLGGVKELGEFSEKSGKDGFSGLNIGATVTMNQVERSETVKKNYIGLYEAIHSVGGQQIRNMATVAGNIANASPAADVPPALAVLGAVCELGRLEESTDGGAKIVRREVPVDEIFIGVGRTVLKPGELILRILVPEIPAGCGSAFRKSARVKLDVAKASAAAFIHREGDNCAELRIAAGSVAPTPVRGRHVENALKGKKMSLEAVKAAAGEIEKDIKPITDVRSTDTYRRRVMKVLVRDAILSAWERAGGEELQ
jgi:carbon-monoxide dehydrogenase medium subunit